MSKYKGGEENFSQDFYKEAIEPDASFEEFSTQQLQQMIEDLKSSLAAKCRNHDNKGEYGTSWILEVAIRKLEEAVTNTKAEKITALRQACKIIKQVPEYVFTQETDIKVLRFMLGQLPEPAGFESTEAEGE